METDHKPVAFSYDGAHSVKFYKDGQWYDTWKNFAMAPQTRPYVSDPPVKTNYIDVPGANGSLDYTEALTGTVMYGNRTGSWNFIVDQGYTDPSLDPAKAAIRFHSDLLKFFHGKRFEKIILSDDDEYYYTGRITVKSKLDTKDYAQVTLEYNMDPYKRPADSTKTLDWKWRELFTNTIMYGKFSVYDSVNGKSRTIYSPEAQDATITVTSPMRLIFGEQEISLTVGDNTISLAAGGNLMTFYGFGIVTVDYAKEKLL